MTYIVLKAPLNSNQPTNRIEMFHQESSISIYFGVNRSKVKITRQTNSAGLGCCNSILVSALF